VGGRQPTHTRRDIVAEQRSNGANFFADVDERGQAFASRFIYSNLY
jgi:hypothetical protein